MWHHITIDLIMVALILTETIVIIIIIQDTIKLLR